MSRETDLDFPLLDIVTSDELHRELLLTVLKRNKVRDPEKYLKENVIESRVIFRNIRSGDSTQMTAAVVINKAAPKDAISSPSSPDEPKNS